MFDYSPIWNILGGASTLINASKATNFIYTITGDLQGNIIRQFNGIRKFRQKISLLQNAGCEIHFHSMQSETYECNLRLIDSAMPEICAHLLLDYYGNGSTTVLEGLQRITQQNPLNYNISRNHSYYNYKISRLFLESALGMSPSKPWNGYLDATGGNVIVKEDGDVLCYHVFNYNQFAQYLLNNTKFKTASTSRYDFGKIYRDENSGCYCLKLNFQIRFIR